MYLTNVFLLISSPQLKTLRLVHPRFAYLELIEKTLFARIKLVATTEHLEHLERANISHIARFVKKVAFTAPPDRCLLTYENFRDLVVAQTILKHGSADQVEKYGSYLYRNYDGNRDFIEKYWNGDFPLSETQIRQKFDQYHKDGLAAKNLLQSEGLRAAWTTALRAIPNSLHLKFVTVTLYDPVQANFLVQPDYDNTDHGHGRYMRVTASLNDALFAAAIGCIANANVKARKLTFEAAVTGDSQWETLPGWEECDFSQVQSFKFLPTHSTRHWGRVEPTDGERGIGEHAADAIAAVLKKCNDSLEELLLYQNDMPMQWPGDEVIPLPKLKKLSYIHQILGLIRPRNMKAWMAKMPSLEHFECRADILPRRSDGTWLDVFEAIRNHPRGMEVKLHSTCADLGMSLDYHTDDFQKYLENAAQEEPWHDLDRRLPLYLSGKIDIDDQIRRILR